VESLKLEVDKLIHQGVAKNNKIEILEENIH